MKTTLKTFVHPHRNIGEGIIGSSEPSRSQRGPIPYEFNNGVYKQLVSKNEHEFKTLNVLWLIVNNILFKLLSLIPALLFYG